MDHLSPESNNNNTALIPISPEASSLTPSTLYAVSSSSVADGKHSSSVQLDVDELLDRNNSICSQAIQRAVSDASNGNYNLNLFEYAGGML